MAESNRKLYIFHAGEKMYHQSRASVCLVRLGARHPPGQVCCFCPVHGTPSAGCRRPRHKSRPVRTRADGPSPSQIWPRIRGAGGSGSACIAAMHDCCWRAEEARAQMRAEEDSDAGRGGLGSSSRMRRRAYSAEEVWDSEPEPQ